MSDMPLSGRFAVTLVLFQVAAAGDDVCSLQRRQKTRNPLRFVLAVAVNRHQSPVVVRLGVAKRRSQSGPVALVGIEADLDLP